MIHRDLKPQNIMMNKRGEVVIMDFGLAAIADQLTGAEARNGTPAYMSPEQIERRGSHGEERYLRAGPGALRTVHRQAAVRREDRAAADGPAGSRAPDQHDARSRRTSTRRWKRSSAAASIPIRASGPRRALAVPAALPGGDPLAAALAAGRNAVAGNGGGLRQDRGHGAPLFRALPGAGGFVPGGGEHHAVRQTAMQHASLDSPPEVLAHRSREIAGQFGYTRKPGDSADWLEHRTTLLKYLGDLPRPRQWDEWLAADAPIRSLYREGPSELYAEPDGSVTLDNPPPTAAGMVAVILEGHGRLLDFQAVPYADDPHANDAPAKPVEPETVFQETGLDMAKFTEIPATMAPPNASDQVRAWKGPHPKVPNTELKVEIAWWKGRVTKARVEYPYMTFGAGGSAPPTVFSQVRDVSGWALWLCGTFAAVLLARRNWKLGRTDRKGALRVAAARLGLSMLWWVGTVHPVPSLRMLDLMQSSAAEWLLPAALMWLVYLALEPALRARWPHSIVTWNRLLAGRIGDAQVGSHILIGAATGCGVWLVMTLISLAGIRDQLQPGGNLFLTLGTRQWLGGHAFTVGHALGAGLMGFFAIFGLRLVVRKDIWAALIASVLFTLGEGEVVMQPHWLIVGAIYWAAFAVLIFVLLRFGLVASITALFFANSFFNVTAPGSDWKAWYAPTGIATLLLLMGIAGFAFWRSLGNREWLGGEEQAG